MAFLRHADSYNMVEARELCMRSGMLEEKAFIEIKQGNISAANETLKSLLPNLRSVLKLAIEFSLKDQRLWQSIMQSCHFDPQRMKILLEYLTEHDEPWKLLEGFSDEMAIGDIGEELV